MYSLKWNVYIIYAHIKYKTSHSTHQLTIFATYTYMYISNKSFGICIHIIYICICLHVHWVCRDGKHKDNPVQTMTAIPCGITIGANSFERYPQKTHQLTLYMIHIRMHICIYIYTIYRYVYMYIHKYTWKIYNHPPTKPFRLCSPSTRIAIIRIRVVNLSSTNLLFAFYAQDHSQPQSYSNCPWTKFLQMKYIFQSTCILILI